MSDRLLKPGSRILFQGDSITDAGRDYADGGSLGLGYASYIAAWLSARAPEQRLEFLNRGISGNRIYDLETRWTEDCIALEPDFVSILIGINDIWRFYDSNMVSPIPEFEACYRRLLDRVHGETKAQVILLEPFVLPTPPDRLAWREDLDQRIDVTRRLARDYGAMLISLDGLFAHSATRREPEFWTVDGVHPTAAGHALIAQAWIQAVENGSPR
jgi:lysophospholipase L1-like esterase